MVNTTLTDAQKKSSEYCGKSTKNVFDGAHLEVVVQRCSVKKVFLTVSQNSQENTCARVSFLIKLQA